jgi:hypothetical protein
MAYIIGLLTQEEITELERRGWDMEDVPPAVLEELQGTPIDPPDEVTAAEFGIATIWKMAWVDSSVFEVMDGPDWDKG